MHARFVGAKVQHGSHAIGVIESVDVGPDGRISATIRHMPRRVLFDLIRTSGSHLQFQNVTVFGNGTVRVLRDDETFEFEVRGKLELTRVIDVKRNYNHVLSANGVEFYCGKGSDAPVEVELVDDGLDEDLSVYSFYDDR